MGELWHPSLGKAERLLHILEWKNKDYWWGKESYLKGQSVQLNSC